MLAYLMTKTAHFMLQILARRGLAAETGLRSSNETILDSLGTDLKAAYSSTPRFPQD